MENNVRTGSPAFRDQVEGFRQFRRRFEKQNKLRWKKTLGAGIEEEDVEELDAEAIENGHITGADFLGEEE
jgi:hypothetical protein